MKIRRIVGRTAGAILLALLVAFARRVVDLDQRL